MCIAMEFQPSVAGLYAKLQGNPQLLYPTFSLALNIFPNANLSVLSFHNSLQYWKLIEI